MPVYDLISMISANRVPDAADLKPGQYYILINKTENSVNDDADPMPTLANKSKNEDDPLVGMSIGRFIKHVESTSPHTNGYFAASGRGEEAFNYNDNVIFNLNAPAAQAGGKRTPKHKSTSRSHKSKSKHRKTRRA